MTMTEFYPHIEPYTSHQLEVGEPHCLYVEESGNPLGIPVIYLHGGPGSGCEAFQRRFFNPEIYRIILFDQRGCGRSTPHASLESNTTWDLVEDIETLRQHLNIEEWILFGGSWGSTLALAYAERHPQRVTAMVLRGIFLGRARDVHWFYQQGTSRLFPEYWQDFIEPIPEPERDHMIQAYYRYLTSDDESVRIKAARAWSLWEGRTANLLLNDDVIHHFGDPKAALSIARIECHYFVNDCFLSANQLINQADKLAHIPGTIVHGRYDVICPVEQAFELHQAWPASQLKVIPDAGHSALEPGIRSVLIEAMDELGKQFS